MKMLVLWWVVAVWVCVGNLVVWGMACLYLRILVHNWVASDVKKSIEHLKFKLLIEYFLYLREIKNVFLLKMCKVYNTNF